MAMGDATARVDESFTHVNISPFLQYYANESGSLSFSDVRDLPDHVWHTSGESVTRFGFTGSADWFRFSIEGESWGLLLLSARNPALSPSTSTA